MVLGAGLLLAFLTLIAEVLCKRKSKQKVMEIRKGFLTLRDLNTFENIESIAKDRCCFFPYKKYLYRDMFFG